MLFKTIAFQFLLIFTPLFFLPVIYAQTLPVELVSTDSSGQIGNEQSVTTGSQRSISADNRYVVFISKASNLVANDTNGVDDVFLKDRQTNTTERINISTAGNEANGESSQASISRDGRYVVFSSSANNLVSGSGAGVYLRDLVNGTTEFIGSGNSGSLSEDGRYIAYSNGGIVVYDRQLNTFTGVASGEYPSISADGRYVAFTSSATNLVPNDNNGFKDVFVHDLVNSTTVRASVNSQGDESDRGGEDAQMSGDGNFVAFTSYATNLTTVNTFNDSQVYVYDIANATTEIVSLNNQGIANDNTVFTPAISDDGRYVAFVGHGSTLGSTGNFEDDVYVRDRQNSTMSMASSYNTTCTRGGGILGVTGISTDGSFISYYTVVSSLPADTNETYDIYLRNMNIAAPISCDLTNLFSAKAWVGLANAADSGIKFDLRARVLRNGDLISGDKILSVDGGGTGFANALQQTIPLPAITPQDMAPGTTLAIRLAVRNACTGSSQNSGTARLWYNGQAADSRFKVTLGGTQFFYYLRDNFALSKQLGGQGEKLFVDVPVGAQCGDWVNFGTWSITF